MNEEDLKKLLTLTEENNQILKKMRRHTQIQSYVRYIYIAIMILFAYGGYVILKPMLGTLNGAIGQYQSLMNIGISGEENINLKQEDVLDMLKTFNLKID
jgi:hypothetical protein